MLGAWSLEPAQQRTGIGDSHSSARILPIENDRHADIVVRLSLVNG
jgi:hypothetical protein